ncbi:MAG: lipopolysaccharide biosynthesis protein [Armatimonadota bacterium]
MEEPSDTSSDNIGARARTAAGWQFLSRGINTPLGMAISIVLARLLMPADFGIVAMAAMVTGLAGIFRTLGLGQALVQRDEITAEHTRSAFWGTAVMAIVLYAAMFFAAPYVGAYFSEPRMIPVLKISALSFILSPFAEVPRSLLQRELDFRTPFFASLAQSFGYGVVGIAMALLGYGYWALVFAGLAGVFMNTVALCALTRYVPPVIPDFRGIGDLYGFGVGMTLWNVAGYTVEQLDYVIVGRRLDTSALGIYSRAFHLSRLPTSLTHAVLTSVLFPVFSRISDDAARFRSAFKRSLALISLFAVPPTVLIAVAGPELIPAVIGEQWLEAVMPLQILCVVVLHRVLMSPGGAALKAVGEVYWISILVGIHGALVVAGAWIGSDYGVNGVAAGVTAAYLIFFVMHAILLTRRLPEWTMGDLWHGLSGALRVSAAVLVVSSLVRYLGIHLGLGTWGILAATITAGAVIGVGVARLITFPDSLQPFEEVRRYIDKAVGAVKQSAAR